MVEIVASQQCRTRMFCYCSKMIASFPCCALLAVILPLFLSGCVANQSYHETGSKTFRTLPSKYQKKAQAYEAKGLLAEAVQSWRVVLYFQPEDLKIQKRINLLQKKSKAKAVIHFNRGVSLYKQGQLREARKEFLLTLAYEPDHDSALNYLTEKLQKKVQKTYVVGSGDTLQSIAKKEYNDPGKDILISSYNGIEPAGQLTSGTSLWLPVLGEDFLAKGSVVKGMAQYDSKSPPPKGKNSKLKISALKTAGSRKKIAEKDTDKLNGLSADTDNYKKAKVYLAQEEYKMAYQMLEKVDVNYRDTSQLKDSTEVFVQQEADAHYRKGISYFLSEDLEKAIDEWKEALRLHPGHLKAKKDLKNARKMQERVKTY